MTLKPTITLTDAIRHAFAPNGPVHSIMGQHRPLQEQMAQGLAHYIQNETNDVEIKVWIQQQRAGIGKTLAVLVTLSLHKLLSGRTSVISTFTRAMRMSYLREVEHIQRIVKQTLDELSASDLYRPLVIREHQSLTPYISPAKIATLEARLTDASPPELRRLVSYFHAAADHGDVPNFQDFFAQGGVLPPNTDPLHWSMCSPDKDHPLYQTVTESNRESRDADVILVTHAMLLRSSIARGKVLRTSNDEEEDPQITGIVLGDEADKLPAVAYDALTMGINHNDILDIMGEFLGRATTESGKAAAAAAQRLVQQGLDYFSRWIEHKLPPRPIIFNLNDPLIERIIEAFGAIDGGMALFRRIALGRYHANDRDMWLADRVLALQQVLRIIGNLPTQTYPKIVMNTFFDTQGRHDVRLSVNFGSGRHLINQLWRMRQSGRTMHSFSGVAFVSATMTDLPPNETSYRWFKTAIGIAINEGDKVIELPPIPDNPRRYPYGSINEVAVVSREWPHPTDDGNLPSMINLHFVKNGGAAITHLANERQRAMGPDTRMLVLFPSFELADAFYEQVPSLHAQIIKRDPTANLFVDIARYTHTDYGIWFGVEWEGVNFVDPDPPDGKLPRTLADILVLTRIPQPPTNPVRRARIADALVQANGSVRAERRADAMALYEGTGTAFRKTMQGVGRGIRNPDDVIKLLAILDLRFPVPLHVVETRKIVRSGGDPAKLFYHFDAILDPYAVRRWSQIDKEGRITAIMQ